MEKYVAVYGNSNFILTDVGMIPFTSIRSVEERVNYFRRNGYLLDAKIYKLEEIDG